MPSFYEMLPGIPGLRDKPFFRGLIWQFTVNSVVENIVEAVGFTAGHQGFNAAYNHLVSHKVKEMGQALNRTASLAAGGLTYWITSPIAHNFPAVIPWLAATAASGYILQSSLLLGDYNDYTDGQLPPSVVETVQLALAAIVGVSIYQATKLGLEHHPNLVQHAAPLAASALAATLQMNNDLIPETLQAAESWVSEAAGGHL